MIMIIIIIKTATINKIKNKYIFINCYKLLQFPQCRANDNHYHVLLQFNFKKTCTYSASLLLYTCQPHKHLNIKVIL